ncbi:MAG: hypothetical protein SFZ02_04725 [bacterium]|nr:hypothetical protein [bacterium]
MSGFIIGDDYIDHDVAYLLGMIVARGTIIDTRDLHKVIIQFPYQNLHVDEDEQGLDIPTSIELGLSRIQTRIVDLLGCQYRQTDTKTSIDLTLTFPSRTIAWRDIVLHLEGKSDYRSMTVPMVIRDDLVPSDVQMEFIKGYADVAGNVRKANRYVDKRNRVRLDVLNENWELPVQLCRLMQNRLNIPVQTITWGHPNLGRGFREHQINIFVAPFQQVGFSFKHKQQMLDKLIEEDKVSEAINEKPYKYAPCPGRRKKRGTKIIHEDEHSERLPESLKGQHFDAYWEVCKALGCKIEPSAPLFDEDVEEI